ncbi:TPA: DNA polymerase III subunit alpha [Clostridium botulinum]|nr:DNA polymerase III subunit alpha [Clostridium botulinum]HBJ1652711.1 DNA polymerase III subunit alpha [Clostridium botulinum]
MSYTALHDHTEYSLLDGFSHPIEYLQRANEIGLKGFAVTEHGNQYSWIYFDKLKKDFPNLKMIYGVEMYECFDINVKDKDSKYFHLVVLAKNEKGRIAINDLITTSNLKGFYYKPRIDLEHLKPYAENIIVSSACLASKLAREKDYNKCIGYINEYKSIFPHFYLEMQSHKSLDQVEYNKKILKLAQDTNTEYIITTDSHCANKEDLKYQGRHVQIAHDSDTMSECYEDCYLQSEEEIHSIMDKQIGKLAVNVALENTNKINDIIEEINMPFQEPQLPTFPLPNGFQDNYEYIKHLLNIGWEKRKINTMSCEDIQIRKERLDYELSVIHDMGFDGYFLVVWDFLNFCRNNNIPTGAGRGSCAGSFVCYLLNITDLDPIKYNLIFERFLNKERISMPDTDSDVCERDKIIAYLIDRYGEDNVCQVINFGYITPIVAIKDVAKVLGIPYKISDLISKRFSYETFEECMIHNPNIYDEFKSKTDEEFNKKLSQLFDIASHIYGRLKQVSIHAGGVGIVDTNVSDYMGMKLGSKGEHVIQVDKKNIEEIGIIKFDILGVQTLNILKEVIEDTGIDAWEININNPNFYNDKKAFDLLCSGETDGVFQVSSFEMKSLLKRLKPRNVEDLSALIALFRPDSMQFIEPYIDNKNNKTLNQIEYIHDNMKPILENTYGCMIYQEQLLEIVRKFAGRTYGGADKFRKGIGKKDKKLIKQESEKLYKEILKQGYDNNIAFTVSDDMANKGGYMFNKSHSVAYAVLCLQTAYLKAHYPSYFYKALLNMVKDDNGKINKFIVDAQNFGVKVQCPNINKSNNGFSINNESILFGLEAISGIGKTLSDKILEERNNNGKFLNMNDFIDRIYPSDSQVVALIKSGAIPTKNKRNCIVKYGKNTFKLSEYKDVKTLPTKKKLLEEWGIDSNLVTDKHERLTLYNNKRRKQFESTKQIKFDKHMSDFCEKYLKDEEMWEFETLSIFLNNNPFIKAYENIKKFEDVDNGDNCVLVGVVSNVVKKKDKNKNQFAYITMYSAYGIIEVTCWSSQFKKYQDIIKKDNKLAILCNKKDDKAFVSKIKSYNKWLIDIK